MSITPSIFFKTIKVNASDETIGLLFGSYCMTNMYMEAVICQATCCKSPHVV